MKEKILFVVGCEVDPEKKSGVATKIFNQKAVLESFFDVFLVGFTPNGIFVCHNDDFERIDFKNRRKKRVEFCKALCANNNIKKCFARGGALEPYTVAMFKTLKNLGVDIVMEIPTYPYDDELKDSVKKRVLLHIDRFFRKILGKYVNRIVTYSEDKTIFGIPCINLLNGIDVFGQSFDEKSEDDSVIHMIGVAKISDWHGFDRLINGLADYKGNQKVVFDLVGSGPALKLCQEIAQKRGVEDSVMFHGFKSGNELEQVYSVANIGIDCLGLHRKGLTRVSSLKSREYAAKGLPIVAANDSDRIIDGWRYIIRVAPTDDAIDIEYILREYNVIKAEGNYRRNIRNFAEQNFDIFNTFMPVVNYFLQ